MPSGSMPASSAMPRSKPRLLQRAWWVGCSGWLLGCANGDAAGLGSHEHVTALPAELRPVPGSATTQPAFSASDRIEHFDSEAGFFRVHYTQRGTHAVPVGDSDGDGVPDYVARVASDFDEVLGFYTQLGYREPLRDGDVPGEHGGDDRFDVYLLNFPNAGADGQFRQDSGCASDSCGGYMMLENDFVGKGYSSLDIAIRLVSSHELFHAVQQAYATEISGWLSEGTAVWASEAFDAEAGDLESQALPYLQRPESSLAQDPSGTDPIRYGGALFFEFIDEHAGRDVLRAMWEQLSDNGETWTQALDDVLHRQDSSLAEQYGTFAEWNLYTAERADPERAYAHGELLAPIKERAIESGYHAKAVRVFPLAARYYAFTASTAQTLSAAAALADPAETEEIEGLELMVAREHAGKLEPADRAPKLRLRQLSVALEAGDTAHIALYNTRDQGSSVRPDLCVISGAAPAETAEAVLARCNDGAADSNEADAGDANADEHTAMTDQGGGCTMSARRPAAGPAWLGPCAALALVLRRLGRVRAGRHTRQRIGVKPTGVHPHEHAKHHDR